jgi:hypothetical protein
LNTRRHPPGTVPDDAGHRARPPRDDVRRESTAALRSRLADELARLEDQLERLDALLGERRS